MMEHGESIEITVSPGEAAVSRVTLRRRWGGHYEATVYAARAEDGPALVQAVIAGLAAPGAKVVAAEGAGDARG